MLELVYMSSHLSHASHGDPCNYLLKGKDRLMELGKKVRNAGGRGREGGGGGCNTNK